MIYYYAVREKDWGYEGVIYSFDIPTNTTHPLWRSGTIWSTKTEAYTDINEWLSDHPDIEAEEE